jgi:hypothetical protein
LELIDGQHRLFGFIYAEHSVQNAENESAGYLKVLRMYFNTINGEFKTEWANPDKYLIATNRGITAFLKLLRSILQTEQQELTKGIAEKYIKALKKHWKGGWETSNLKKSYVGSQGWKQFHDDMVDAIRKGDFWGQTPNLETQEFGVCPQKSAIACLLTANWQFCALL